MSKSIRVGPGRANCGPLEARERNFPASSGPVILPENAVDFPPRVSSNLRCLTFRFGFDVHLGANPHSVERPMDKEERDGEEQRGQYVG